MRIFASILFLLGVLLSPSVALAMTCAEAAEAKFGDTVELAHCAEQCGALPNQFFEESISAPFVIDDCGTQFCCAKLKGAPPEKAAPTYDQKYGYENPLGNATVPQLIGRIITQVLPLVGSLFLLMFIWGGFLWLTSDGDETHIKKARTTLTNAVIGLAIIMAAYIIVSFLLNTLAKAVLG